MEEERKIGRQTVEEREGATDEELRQSRTDVIVALAMLLGLASNYAGFNAVKMLFWSAVLNGVLAPPLIVLVVLLTGSRSVMGDRVNLPLLKWLGWMTAAVMTIAAVALLRLCSRSDNPPTADSTSPVSRLAIRDRVQASQTEPVSKQMTALATSLVSSRPDALVASEVCGIRRTLRMRRPSRRSTTNLLPL